MDGWSADERKASQFVSWRLALRARLDGPTCCEHYLSYYGFGRVSILLYLQADLLDFLHVAELGLRELAPSTGGQVRLC